MQQTLNCDDEKGIVEENQQNSEAGQTNGLETQDVSDKVYYHFMFFFFFFLLKKNPNSLPC